MLGKIKNELDRQMAAARIISKSKISQLTASSLANSYAHGDDEQDEFDRDYEENLTVKALLEDLTSNQDRCAFPSVNDNQCFSNKQVYGLVNNRSDLMKISRSIEQQLYKPNEQMCTSIHLSMSTVFIGRPAGGERKSSGFFDRSIDLTVIVISIASFK